MGIFQIMSYAEPECVLNGFPVYNLTKIHISPSGERDGLRDRSVDIFIYVLSPSYTVHSLMRGQMDENTYFKK